jgi:RNA-directed DNA polymerase
MRNVIDLHQSLATKTYQHSPYEAFNISDPKPRSIHKASVRDRLLHHALYRVLYPQFDQTFIADSYSCRRDKGVHKALNRFRVFGYKVGKNNTRTVWVLKCDIRKFFASIKHEVLLAILRERIQDSNILWVFSQITKSFDLGNEGVGLPLGNLTSQLLVNIYMNEFDQFVKQGLKVKYYLRYADDFVFLSSDRSYLEKLLPRISDFLKEELRLSLHPNKVSISTLSSGVDFLGWIHFADHRVLRTTTKRRMWRGIKNKNGKEESVQSYLGLLGHGNTWKLKQQLKAELEKLDPS